MKMPRINVETQKAVYEVHTTRARLNIRAVHPRMRITRKTPQLSVNRKMPSFKVDWSKVRTESGLAPPEQMIRQFRDQGKAGAYDAIGRISSEGDRLMRIENKGDNVIEMVADYVEEKSRKEVNVGLIPQSSPNIEWEHGYVNMEWTLPQLDIEWELGKLEISVEPHSIEVSMRQYPEVKISVVEGSAHRDRGRSVDKKI